MCFANVFTMCYIFGGHLMRHTEGVYFLHLVSFTAWRTPCGPQHNLAEVKTSVSGLAEPGH